AGARWALEERFARRPVPAAWLLGRLGLPEDGAAEQELWRLDAGGDRRLVASALLFRCLPPRLPVETLLCLAAAGVAANDAEPPGLEGKATGRRPSNGARSSPRPD
ncbi:MAG TPA: hypothetical protein VJB36_01345, partial [Methylomirabilota bacterium]|nr:hypothetical protein [Methylomirabilota bacterium]